MSFKIKKGRLTLSTRAGYQKSKELKREVRKRMR